MGHRKKIQSKVLNKFWGRGGWGRGIQARFIKGVMYSLRRLGIRDGKAKTKTRVKMEELYDGRGFFGKKGMDVKHRGGEYF